MKIFLYLLVLVVSFGPSALLFILGVIFSPVWVYSLIESGFFTLIPLLLVIAGGFGFWGMLALNNLTLHPHRTDTSPKRLVIYLSLGILSSCVVTGFAVYLDWKLAIVMFLPIPVTGYLTFRNRTYFCNLA
ncbi:hypothetical protein [Aliiglaciecola lipolytica]|uniref:Uncharacterized protein n=1 Tax=Aliiglaciecola lipolytica E3 TaxID=1127673 RepID=K6XX34_9ALTE|nr:hypothetical protein [Aliiglaciecola lipolytica]GAC16211.1 hypothetical protein GLIP_3600 [Aliiglaciecola lipolytica E3]